MSDAREVTPVPELPKVLRDNGEEAGPNEGGLLVIERPWPSMLRTVWGDDARFKATYFSRFPGKYFTGDGARRDQDGYFWVMGRVDDVVNVAGHRLGTAEVESVLVAHEAVAEAAVVGRPDALKGQALEVRARLSQVISTRKRIVGGFYAYDNRTEVKELGTLCSGASDDRGQLACSATLDTAGQVELVVQAKDAAGHVAQAASSAWCSDKLPSVEPKTLSWRMNRWMVF